jgi:hypothetical protein
MPKNSRRNRAAENAAKLAAEEAAKLAAENAAEEEEEYEEDDDILTPKIEDKEGDDTEENKEKKKKGVFKWLKEQYEKEHKLPSWSVKKIVTAVTGAAVGAAAIVTAYRLGEAVGAGTINDQLELENTDTGDSEVIDGDYEEEE